MSAAATVSVGQTWLDNDKRFRERRIRITAIEGAFAYGWVIDANDKALRETRIALKRFKPNSTGYRLESK